MAVAILLGILIGVVGFLPLVFALRITRRAYRAGIGANVAIVLLCLFISLAFYVASLLIFKEANPNYLVAFAITIVFSLITCAIASVLFVKFKL